jgi:hypothetical protein
MVKVITIFKTPQSTFKYWDQNWVESEILCVIGAVILLTTCEIEQSVIDRKEHFTGLSSLLPWIPLTRP